LLILTADCRLKTIASGGGFSIKQSKIINNLLRVCEEARDYRSVIVLTSSRLTLK